MKKLLTIDQQLQIDNMSPEERDIQRALGLLCDWIVIVEDLAKLPKRNPYQYNHLFEISDESHRTYVVVEAINLQHAHLLINQSNCFPKNDFRKCGGWQSNIAGAYYRKRYVDKRRGPHSLYEARICIL